MTRRELTHRLASQDPDDVLDALFELCAPHTEEPSPGLLEQAMTLFAHVDPDVRRQAVVAVGVHWGHVPAMSVLARILPDEVDDDVVLAQIGAISRIAESAQAGLRQVALDALDRVARDDKRQSRIRRRAVVELRWLQGVTTAAEHANELAGA